MSSGDWFHWAGDDLLLELKLLPRSSRDAFAAAHNGRLRVRITAPPVDGKANVHLVAWLATQFGVAKGQVHIELGLTSPLKRVRIQAPRRLPDDLGSAKRP